MKTYVGTVINSEVAKNRDGENNVRMLTVELAEPGDNPTIQIMTSSGDDTTPMKGDEVTVLEISESYRVVIASNDDIDPTTEDGERKIYSRDGNGDLASFIYLKKDGKIEINGSGDFAVRFTALETALNLLTVKINAALGAKLDGTGTPGTISQSFTSAKVDTVELPL